MGMLLYQRGMEKKVEFEIRSSKNCQKWWGTMKYCLRPYKRTNVTGIVTVANIVKEEKTKPLVDLNCVF